MRVWLDPSRVAALNLTPVDISNAIREQNQQVVAGSLGAQPVARADFNILMNVKGRLDSVEEFENIIIKFFKNIFKIWCTSGNQYRN